MNNKWVIGAAGIVVFAVVALAFYHYVLPATLLVGPEEDTAEGDATAAAREDAIARAREIRQSRLEREAAAAQSGDTPPGEADTGAEMNDLLWDADTSTSNGAVRGAQREDNGDDAEEGARNGDRAAARQRAEEDAANGDSAQDERARAERRASALVSRARNSLRNGDYALAEQLLRESLELDPQNSMAWRQMGQLYRQTGSPQDEIAAYQQWLENVPGATDPYYLLADAYARAGMDGDALRYIGAYEDMANGTMSDYLRISHLYRRVNAREDEGRVLAQWTQAAPDSMDARRAWADYQQRMGNYGEALSHYEVMAGAMPDDPRPYRQMAEIYRRVGDYEQAQYHYEAALAARPGDISTMNRLADVHRSSGDLYGAMNVYAEIIALEPGSSAAARAARHIQQIERRLGY